MDGNKFETLHTGPLCGESQGKTDSKKKEADFIAGSGGVNVDLLFAGLPRIPGEGEELYSKSFSMMLGGGVPGTLVLLKRLGIPVRLQTGLGTDSFSSFAADCFAKEGMEITNLSEGTSKIPVNISSVLITPGDRTFVSYTDSIEKTRENAEKIYQSSRGASLCLMNPAYPEVYERLKAEGTRIVFDMGWNDDLSLETCAPLLTIADYYTPNRKEALKLTGTDTPEKAAEVLSRYLKTVVIKLDKDGCLLYENGEFQTIPVIPGIKAVDSTGAGDAFLAGFLYGIYHGYSSAEAILFGNLTGGTCVTAIGCLTASLTEAELLKGAEEFM